jgi:hypothetical protein
MQKISPNPGQGQLRAASPFTVDVRCGCASQPRRTDCKARDFSFETTHR